VAERAGASTGDVLSLLLQERMREDGVPARLRDGYRKQDLRAFAVTLDAYKAERRAELLPAGGAPARDERDSASDASER